jgi:tetrahydromethanopterin S-methyltransferase subunit G
MIDANRPLLPPVSIPPADQNRLPLRKKKRSQSVSQIEQRVSAVTHPRKSEHTDNPFICTGVTSSDVGQRRKESFSPEIEEDLERNLTDVNKTVDKVREDLLQKLEENFQSRIRNLTGIDRMGERVNTRANEIIQQEGERVQRDKNRFYFKTSRVIAIFLTFVTQTIQKIKNLWEQIKEPLKEGLIFAMSILPKIKIGKLGSWGFIKIGALFSLKFKYKSENQNPQQATPPPQLNVHGNYVANQTIIFNGLPPEGTISEIALHCRGCNLHTVHSLTSSPSLPPIAVDSH